MIVRKLPKPTKHEYINDALLKQSQKFLLKNLSRFLIALFILFTLHLIFNVHESYIIIAIWVSIFTFIIYMINKWYKS